MAIRSILLLGDPTLHDPCEDVQRDELARLGDGVEDLRDTLLDVRARLGFGRAIAAPQIGWRKRVVYCHVHEPATLLNPTLVDPSEDTFELWDDCLCFPDLLVRVRRHRAVTLRYRDLEWRAREERLEGALAELLQHEVDHLDGILATERALGRRSFALRARNEESRAVHGANSSRARSG